MIKQFFSLNLYKPLITTPLETKLSRYNVRTDKKNKIIVEEVSQDEINEFWDKLKDLYTTF